MKRFIARLVAFVRHADADTDLTREINAHLQLLEDDFIAKGLTPVEARFAARRAFGGQVEQTKERHRDERSFRVLDQWWLDVKLALRMLVRYPGLTIVSTLGMAVAIAIAAGAFSIVNGLLRPTLPLDDGDRVVAVQNWDAAKNDADRRSLHDVATWRTEVSAIEDLGVFRQLNRTLIAPGVQPEVVRVAAMSASGFRVARVAPFSGRYLLDDDERVGARPVVVIGHDAWRTRFHSDPNVLGRDVSLGATRYTIVGVMPAGFAFPVNHAYWVPLSEEPVAVERRAGPDVWAFGRLAPGATLEMAQAQLTTIGQRFAAAWPETHAQLRPQVVPYTYPFTDMDDPSNAIALRVMQFLVALLLGIVCVNVAILVYARTATRHVEIAVRTALGAGRRRIVAQLFVEALAVALLAAVLGIGIVALALREVDAALIQIAGQLPFWMHFSLAAGDVVYALLLAVGAASVVGVVPALKATGASVQNGLKESAAGANAGLRLGNTWTALIVAQVALAVALLPTALYHAWDATRHGVSDPGFAAHEFLTAQLLVEGELRPSSRFADRHAEVMRRLWASPQVASTASALVAPGFEPAAWVNVDGIASPVQPDDYRVLTGSSLGHRVMFNRVDAEWLNAFQVPVIAGRAFVNADTTGINSAAIVNRTFVEQVLRGEHPIGRRFQYVGLSGDARADDVDLTRWFEIVGVVADFPRNAMGSGTLQPKVYHPLDAGTYPVTLSIRVRDGDALTFAGHTLQTIAAVDPSLQLRGLRRLDDLLLQEQSIFRVIGAVLILLTLSVVALSAAGIYAMMACTVEQRRKEIGIRAALGADSRRILAAVFARALGQLAAGAAVGFAIAAILEIGSEGELMANNGTVLMPLVACAMTLVGILAAWVPARRGLRIHPIDTLRAE